MPDQNKFVPSPFGDKIMGMSRQHELEYKIIYSCIVAGKSAKFADAVMERLFDGRITAEYPPLHVIRAWLVGKPWRLENNLRVARSGNYGKLVACLQELAQNAPNLEECSASRLEQIKGIGPKTSRFFLLWTRPGVRVAALDTHILKWLRYLGYNAPKSTPSGALYATLERVFLHEADERGVDPGALDFEVWQYYQTGANGPMPELIQKRGPAKKSRTEASAPAATKAA